MALFRIYLACVLACTTVYTMVVTVHHGWNLFPAFFSNIAEMTWSGQFNLDFMTYLGLSGIWVAWRHQLTGRAIGLGIVAIFGGTMFLAPYLIWASAQSRGDVRVLLLGKARAGR